MKFKSLVMKSTASILALTLMPTLFDGVTLRASTDEVEVDGKFYSWNEEDSGYNFSTATGSSTSSSDTYGDFYISGDLEETDKHNGVTSYYVESDNNVALDTTRGDSTDKNISIYYDYDDSLISDNDDGDVNWHITDDSSKNVDTISLESKIKSGVIIIQTSLDGENWVNDEIMTDRFDTVRSQTDPIFTTNDIQLLNGTYYRVIVAYRQKKLAGTNGFFVFRISDYDYKECVEVYEFYLESEYSYAYEDDNGDSTRVGTRYLVDDNDGYTGTTTQLESNNLQYGWELGNFYMSGYSAREGNDDNYVFLKNVGDRVCLRFDLLQDINALNDDEDLFIQDDEDSSDSYYETDTDMKFERGTLLIKYTDSSNNPTIVPAYTNFLEANTSAGASTRVYLFEEGDYEVSLDYAIEQEKVGLNKVEYYKITFKFSIRNGNCAVFPFDVDTESELTNMDRTENGFVIDRAGSMYLDITVTEYDLNSRGNGLDQRSSRKVSSSRKEYTSEGIYVIEATNSDYASRGQTKIICVGADGSSISEFFENHLNDISDFIN